MLDNTKDSQPVKREMPHTRRLIDPRLEALLVFVGLGLFSLLYYSRTPWGTILGFVVLLVTGIFWGYSIRYVNRMTLRDFRFISRRWLLYAVFGILTGAFGWGFQQAITKLQYGHWLSIDYRASTALIGSIIMVVIAEEVFFRGYLLTRMCAFTNKVWIQILFVCMAWGLYKVLIHAWEGRPVSYYVWLFFTETYLTVPLTWWAYYTKSISTPLVSHMVWDFLMYGTRETIPSWVF